MAGAVTIAAEMKPDQILLINLSGSGDKDVIVASELLGAES